MTHDAAVRAVRNDTRVRRALGNDVQATPPMSQMSNSSSVNGVTVQTSTIGFVLQDARTGKQAQAQAKGTTGADGALRVDVAVTVMGTGESPPRGCHKRCRCGGVLGGGLQPHGGEQSVG